MDRVRRLDATLVAGVATLRWKLLMLRLIRICKSACGDIALLKLIGAHRLKQSPPNDLKSFLGARGPPRRFDTADYISQAIESFTSPNTANFDIISLCMR